MYILSGVQKIIETQNCARMLMRSKVAMHVETVVLLSKQKSSKKIEVDLDISELDLTKAEAKATYAEIKQYVLDKFGLKVSQLYVAQVKRELVEQFELISDCPV